MGLGLPKFGIGSTPFGPLKGFGGGGNAGSLKSLFDQMQRQQNLRYTQAAGYQQQGLQGIRTGYDDAIRNVGRQGLSSKLGIEQAGQQGQAAASQSLAKSGLSNSALGAQIPGVAMGQTAQNLAAVDQAVAGATAGLLTSKANALNSAYGGLSHLAQNQNQGELNLGMLAYNQIASQPDEMEYLMQLLGLGTQAGMMAFGGGFGGAGAARYAGGGA